MTADVRRIEPIAPPEDAFIRVPGSRSITNRALICAALATGTSRLRGWLEADDTIAMREGVVALGATIREDGTDLVVEGTKGRVFPPRRAIDCRLSGSTLRFLTAIGALADGWVSLDGGAPLRARPLGPLLTALDRAHVSVRSSDGHAPVSVCGPLLGGSLDLDASTSGQYLSGLLLAGPCMRDGVRVETGIVAREPFVEMTRRVMEAFGARVTKLWAKTAEIPGTPQQGYKVVGAYRSSWIVPASGYTAADYAIEADVMSASYFFAAGAVTRGTVVVDGIRRDSMQGDIAVLDALEAMGCVVEQLPNAIRVTGRPLRGTTVDVSAIADMAPTVAVVALFADSPTTITGVRDLRIKESDRLAALQTELTKLGARVTIAAGDEAMTIEPPRTFQAARIATYDDHRIAMAFSVAGLASGGIEIEDPGCVAKTFPGFYDVLERLRT